jgi:hypothetical protein
MAASKFPIEAGHITMFARAIGDANPAYDVLRTDAREMLAPPTFVTASAQFDPDYPLRPKPGGDGWFGSGGTSSGEKPVAGQPVRKGGGGLHAEQHYEYRRPLRPGMVLTAKPGQGKSWEKQNRQGNTLHFNESVTEYFDQDGELVVVARAVSVKPAPAGGK